MAPPLPSLVWLSDSCTVLSTQVSKNTDRHPQRILNNNKNNQTKTKVGITTRDRNNNMSKLETGEYSSFNWPSTQSFLSSYASLLKMMTITQIPATVPFLKHQSVTHANGHNPLNLIEPTDTTQHKKGTNWWTFANSPREHLRSHDCVASPRPNCTWTSQ